MKSFKQHIIAEKRAPLVQKRGTGWTGTVLGLEDPSPMEILGFLRKLRFGTGRFIVDNKGKLLVWDADDALHQEVLRGEEWDRHETTLGVFEFIQDMVTKKYTELQIQVFNARPGVKKSRTLQALKKRKGTVWQAFPIA